MIRRLPSEIAALENRRQERKQFIIDIAWWLPYIVLCLLICWHVSLFLLLFPLIALEYSIRNVLPSRQAKQEHRIRVEEVKTRVYDEFELEAMEEVERFLEQKP